MRKKGRRIGLLTWRVAAYVGEYLAHGADLPLVTEVGGELTPEPSGPIGGGDARSQLLAVVAALHAQQESQYPLRPFAPVSHHMTVSVESLESLEGKTSSTIARLDMTRERRYAHASLLVRNQPRIDLEPVWIEQPDGVLDVFTRLQWPARQ
jgi:hypothetical protein